ncbi:hypothetical protein LAZ67_23001114 [Cordylochernes scorpioides]|uniref:Integrase p58-like C-terminal domain-containing protein n=1 Tax=Cordylochernes scorpioides TaxID=51811 RepID=A0ABY6LUP9_9ARAC|nr:hypothetical protein LAZ67_23001114 [Cordylochernes scorpioides]
MKKGLSPKLMPVWEGPYKIIKRNNDLVYRIQRSSKSKAKVVHLRLLFSVMVAFAMTINKSQGQTLQVVGVHLESPCFSQAKLYVACSRVSSPRNLFVFNFTFSKTRNIVYKRALI